MAEEAFLVCDACQLPLEDDMMATPCGHLMHAACVQALFHPKPAIFSWDWWQGKPCPTCSEKIKLADCKKVFLSSYKEDKREEGGGDGEELRYSKLPVRCMNYEN